MDKLFIQKLRRFSLAIGLILFAYSIAGIKLDTPAKINPLGIPLVIENPNLIGIALVLATLYATLRYLYYAVLIGPAPHTLRKRLKKNILPDGSGLNSFEDDYMNKFCYKMDIAIREVFPRVGNSEATAQSCNVEGTIIKVPRVISFFIFLENIDYYSPIWVNIIAIAAYKLV